MSKALQYAFRLLKYRLRSEYELIQRLKRKGFSDQDINQTISYLKERAWVNDYEFARIWVESRIKKPLGVYRLRQELRLKGIDKDLIEQTLKDASKRYSEEDMIKQIISQRWKRLKNIPTRKAKQRLFLYLLQRGFSSDTIREAIEQL